MFLNYYNLEFYFCRQIQSNFTILYVFLNQNFYELFYADKFEFNCNLLCKNCKSRQIYRKYYKIIVKKCFDNFVFFVILYDLTQGLQEFLNQHSFKKVYFTQNNVVYQKKVSQWQHILKYLKQSQFYN